MNRFDNAVVYHIYPLGYCGRLEANEFKTYPGEGRILRVLKHIPVIKEMGFNAVYIGPVFESTRHGYDTADYTKIDSRLGTNAEFKLVCGEFKKHGIKIVLDAVFNHVGRDFWAFKDLKTNGLGSRYASWFHVRGGNSNYNDGFWYEGWEGHFDLVKLNLHNPEVKAHIKDAISGWVKEFGIDGLRLDVAYCLELDFLRELRAHCKALKSDFWLMGETLHGDYNKWFNPEMLDSVTNYQCYKGLFSSFNDLNMFEIAHSIDRMKSLYGNEGKRLYIFVDNHDVSRIASALKDPRHLKGVYTLMFTMPGVPGVYYGSEYGLKAEKSGGDDGLRPEFKLGDHKETELTHTIERAAKAHAALKPLYAGDYRQVVLQNQFFAFARSCDGETVYALINAGANAVDFRLGGSGMYTDLLGGGTYDISREIKLAAYDTMILAVNDGKLKAEPVRKAEPVQKPEPALVQKPEPAQIPEPARIPEPVQKPEPKKDYSEHIRAIYKSLKALADEMEVDLE